MRILLAILVLLLLIAGVTPYVTGYRFKEIYLQQIARFQERTQDKGMKIEVAEYKLGWLKSTAKLKVTFTDTSANKYNMPPMVMMVDSYIDHGPIIYNFQTHKVTYAYAMVNTNVHLPDMIKAFVPDNGSGFMQITATVPFDTKIWHNHFVIQPVNLLNKVSWNGLTGDAVVTYDQNKPMTIQGNFIFGALTIPADPAYPDMPQINISPLNYTVNSKKESIDIYSGTSSLSTDGFIATWKNGKVLTVSNYTMASNYGLTSGNLYQLSEQSTLKTIQLPANYPVTSITDIKEAFNVNDLKPEGLHNLADFMRSFKDDQATPPNPDVVFDKVMQVFTPTSNIGWTISMNTNLGATTTNLKIYWQALPTTIKDLSDTINVDFNARLSASLVENVLTRYFASKIPPKAAAPTPTATPVGSDIYKLAVADLVKTQKISLADSLTLLGYQDQKLSAVEFSDKLKAMSSLTPEVTTQLENSYNQQLAAQPKPEPETATVDPVQQTQQTLAQLIQIGYIVKDNNDYMISLTKKGKQVILNGKDVSDQFQQMMESKTNGASETQVAPAPAT